MVVLLLITKWNRGQAMCRSTISGFRQFRENPRPIRDGGEKNLPALVDVEPAVSSSTGEHTSTRPSNSQLG
jgi:hypothetical protein